MKNLDIDLDILKIAAKTLQPLKDDLVFLGGATISIYITEPIHVKIRETLDVDCVVEVGHRLEYEDIARKLRSLGFSEDMDSHVICRFKKDSLVLDVMPTNPKILGFTNMWYKEGYQKAKTYQIENVTIKVFDLPYLIATKIEAFKGRGKDGFLYSHDIEDIISLFDGRPSIAEDLKKCDQNLLKYLKKEMENFLNNKNFVNSLDGHISDRLNIDGRKQIILERIKNFLT